MQPTSGIHPLRAAGAVAFAAAALSTAPPRLSAQDAEPEAPRVIVIGSYIPTAESEGPLPVTVYTASTLQKIGANTPVEGLRQLPSFVGNTATENDSNGGNGSAFIAIRGLGPANTLTLINGRRAATNGFANVNAIPIGALARTEILKDGAGAIYGSDAVAGVANLILINGPGTTPLNGVEIDLLYGNTTNKDGRVIQGYIRGGFSNEKLSIAFAAEYYDRDGIFSRDREVSTSSNRLPLGGNNGGSPTFPGRATLGGTASQGGGARILVNPTALPTGPASYRAYGGPASDDPFNFRLYTPAIPPQEKYQTYVTGSYNIFGKAMVFYADMLYAKTKQDNGLAPAPFTLTRADGVHLSPFNPFGNFASPSAGGPVPSRNVTAVQYRLVDEAGNRRSFFDSDNYRYTVGLKGDFIFKNNAFIDFLSYDGGIVYERSDNLRIDRGDAQRTLIVNELAAGNFNPFRGLGSPAVGTAPIYNAAGVQIGTRAYDNQAAINRASYVGRSFFNAQDFLIDARVSGNLFPNLPQGGIGFNVGMEFRSSRSTSTPDAVQVAGDQLGFNAAPNTKYKQEVKSFFAEVSLPVVTPKMKVPLVRSFDFGVALRYEEFENFDQRTGGFLAADGVTLIPGTKKVNSGVKPRFTVRYSPIEDITIRGSYGESFLAPTPGQLFAPQAQNFPNLFDPLSGQTLQVSTFQGGNPNLTPEESKSWTAGIAITPRWIKGLTITVDYYQVITRDVILPAANFAQLVLTANGNSGGTAFANLVTRDPDTRLPTNINAITANAGKRFVSGLDATAVYQLPYERFGQFTLSAGVNYFFSWKAEGIAGVGATNFLGQYNNGTQPLAPGAIPRLKGFARLEWAWKGFEWVGTVNYIGEFKDDPAFVLNAAILPRTVPSYVTFDTQLSYEFKRPKGTTEMVDSKGVRTQVAADNSGTFAQKMLWGTKLKVGVVNLFDRQPPSVLGAFNDNYDTSLYSIRNRYVYVGINKKF